MSRVSIGIGLLALCLAAAGCDGDAPPPSERRIAFDAAVTAWREGGEFFLAKENDASRESFFRAHRLALGALDREGEPSDAVIDNLLANVCCELGQYAPGYLGRAARYAERALATDPEWPQALFSLGLAYQRMGLSLKAAEIYEGLLARLVPGETREGVVNNLIEVLLRYASRTLREDRLGAERRAREFVDRAWVVRQDASGNPASEFREKLMQAYAEQANAAVKERDQLALARVHARFGEDVPANEALTFARNALGRTLEVRWTEARFVEELAGTPESLAAAAKHYDELMGRGERIAHAAAGFGRVLLALGRGEEALQRLKDFPAPTAELRRALVLLRLSRIAAIEPDRREEATPEFEAIDELLVGGMEEWDRADLLLRVASEGMRLADTGRVSRTIREFQKRFPRDPRILVIDAGLQKLAGEPTDRPPSEDDR